MIERVLIDVHLLLGLVILTLVAAILVLAAPVALRGKAAPPLYGVLHRAAAMLIVAEVAVGIVLFAIGHRPSDSLHLVYALAAILVMPLARSLVRRSHSRARLYQIGGTVLLLGVLFRLATTG